MELSAPPSLQPEEAKALGRLAVLRDHLVTVRAVKAHLDTLLEERDVAVVDEVLGDRARIVLGNGPAEVAEG
eukprot:2013886-Alexandrium_andersonii.AAC.1